MLLTDLSVFTAKEMEFLMSPKKSRIIDRILHWISAGFILFLLIDMAFKVHRVDYRIKGPEVHKQDAIELHLLMALLLLLILFARIVWYHFFLDGKYRLKYESTKHKLFVRLAHTSMYAILVLLMLSGILMVLNYEHSISILGVVNLAENNVERSLFLNAHSWHLYFQNAIYYLIFIHLAGVVYSRR